jgi:uncharacterized protein (TIGR00162 family)
MAKTPENPAMVRPSTGAFVREHSRPKLSSPLVVVGLPGIGLVSKLTADNMVRTLKAKRIATIYSPHFPNQVLSLSNGRLRPFGMYVFSAKAGNRDLLIVKGDLQPITVEGQYEVCSALLEYCAGFGATVAIAMAGYATNKKADKPAVHASATHAMLLKKVLKAGASKSEGTVPIIGMAGLLPALAPVYGMNGACLLVQTPGSHVDPAGAQALTEFLGRYIGAKLDASGLGKLAKKAQGMISQFENQARGAEPQAAAGPTPVPAPELLKKDTLNYIR